MTKLQKEEMFKARENLKAMFEREKTDRVYTTLEHVSKSGMMRVIRLYIIGEDKSPLNITHLACNAIPTKFNTKHYGMEMGGCGMDMGFAAVYELSVSLYCPDKYEHDKAYKLKHQWL